MKKRLRPSVSLAVKAGLPRPVRASLMKKRLRLFDPPTQRSCRRDP